MKLLDYLKICKSSPQKEKVKRKALSVLLSATVLLATGLSEMSAGTAHVYAAETLSSETETAAQTEQPQTEPKTETLPSETETAAQTEQPQTEPKTEMLPSETETAAQTEQSETEPKTETLPSETETEPKTEALPPETETEPKTETLPSETETAAQTEQSESVSEGTSPENESEPESGSELPEEETELSAAVREFLDSVKALPETITQENAEEVERLLAICDAAYQKLTREEKAFPEVVEAFEKVQELLDIVAYKTEYGEQVTIDGITYKFDFDTDTRTAALDDILEPEKQTAVKVPEKVTYQGEEYTVTKSKLSWRSSKGYRDNVTELILPDTITEITGNFRQFRQLESITIPGSVKAFKADNAFMYMNKLKKIIFGEGVEEISSVYMVDSCTSLTTIQLPDTLRLIDKPSVFAGAPALTQITFPEGLQFGQNAVNMFKDCTSLQSITLPASVTKIPSSMFSGCTNLQSVRANGTITEVGNYAFYDSDNDAGCELLTEIPDLSQVTSMGTSAFRSCKGLRDVSVNLSSLTEIPAYAFTYTSANITAFSENLQSIGKWALIYCSIAGNSDDGMTFTFPETLTFIDTYAFYAGNLPEMVVLPDTITQVAANAFSDVSGIREFWIGSGVTVINEGAFVAEGIQKITVNNSKDALTTPENFPQGVEIEYLFASIGEVGDTISDREGAPTLQEAVNDAGEGETITIEKDVKLAETLHILSGKNVTITCKDTFTVLGDSKEKIRNLIEVEAGASVTFAGSLVLSGRYNSNSIIAAKGQVTLTGNAAVSNGRIANGYTGIIDISGANAGFTMNGGTVEKNSVNG